MEKGVGQFLTLPDISSKMTSHPKANTQHIQQMPWIAPRPCCGIGNRLFQTMAAVGEAERQGKEPVFFLPRMCHYEHGEFALLQKLFPTLRLLESESTWEEVKENSDGTIPPLTATQQVPVVLSGFFQNSKNFPSPNSRHLPRLPTKEPLPPLKKAWAVHFRLGDYKILPHHQVALGPYYTQTILSKIPKGSRLILFSDSPDALPAIAMELEEMGYLPMIYEGTDVLETFKAFSACSLGAICSNSTFTWWAAYFTQERIDSLPDYRAYFPSVWMPGRDAPQVLNLPFTQVVDIKTLPLTPTLKSFTY